jgi:hypothetical protein
MAPSEDPVRPIHKDRGLIVVVLALVVVAHQLRGWPALVLAILAAGAAAGLLAGQVFDVPATALPVRAEPRRSHRRAA